MLTPKTSGRYHHPPECGRRKNHFSLVSLIGTDLVGPILTPSTLFLFPRSEGKTPIYLTEKFVLATRISDILLAAHSSISLPTGLFLFILFKGHNVKILVALNSKAHFKLYDFAFSKIGFHILDIVDNGAEAISKYVSHQNEIEMMFIDGQMPDMTGMEAAAKILKEDPNANIVVLTEKSSDFVEDVYPLHTGKLSIKPFDLKKRFNKMPNQ